MGENEVFGELTQRIDQFDLSALFKALDQSGVDLDKLLYVGTQKQISTSRLCEEIHPPKDSIVSGTVKLNLGLLTPASPLPSYYRKSLENGELDEESFLSFLQFFNHHVIKNILKFTWVEKFFIPEWDSVKKSCLSMMGLDSVSSMHWLFSLYFPELKVSIRKGTKDRRMHSADFTLGISRLGEKDAFGGYVRRKIKNYTVEFYSEVAQTESRVFWPTEIRNRLKEHILPLLDKTDIHLVVNFTIDQYQRATSLNRQSNVGYTSLGETMSNLTWPLFES